MWQNIKKLISKLWTTFVLVLILLILALAFWSTSTYDHYGLPWWARRIAQLVLEILISFAVLAIIYTWWRPAFIERWHAYQANKVKLIILGLRCAFILMLLFTAAMGLTEWFK